MIWLLEIALQFFRKPTVSADMPICHQPPGQGALRRGWLPVVASAAALWLAGPAPASHADDRGKLIGTFQTRPGQTQPDVARDDVRDQGRARGPDSRGPDSLDWRAGARAAGGRNFLTGETSVSHSAEDTFRRDAGDRIFFGTGSVEIGARARAVLAAQAEWLKRNPILRLTIEGHADDGGTVDQNIKLSAERADAVRERLVAEGVEARRIAVVARGREDRVAVCGDTGCMAQNRRAVTVVHASGAGERIGFDRQRAMPGAAQTLPDADSGRKGPVPR